MKKSVKFLKIILVIIVLLTLTWYLFGENGPLADKGEYFRNYISTLLAGDDAAEEEITEAEPEDEAQPIVEEPIVEEIDGTASIVFTGDIEISEYVQAKYDAAGIEGIIDSELITLMNDATVTMINNEFCFSTRGTKAPDKQFTFRVDPGYVSILTELGTDIAGLANNHVLDYGHDALTDTFSTLTDAGIDYTGAGNDLEDASKLIVKTDEKDRTYGFLAASHVIPVYSWDVRSQTPGVFTFYDSAELIAAVEAASTQVDYLFVMVHWGVERTTELEDYQVNEGHSIIDAGAYAVIGMHSHCLQPVEYYNGHPIFYSLGNYIFNANISSGAAVAFDLDENDNVSVRVLPVSAADTFTYINTDLLDELDNMSDTVTIDDEGYITSK